MSFSVGIDTFNISIPKGSGVATYGFNLNSSLRELGIETHLLYSPEGGLAGSGLVSEMSLFDAPTPTPTSPSIYSDFASIVRDIKAMTSPLGRTAQRIAVSGAIITRQIPRRAPACSQLWGCGDLFRGAHRGYGAWGKFTPLTFDEAEGAAPNVMHWTYVLPIRAKGRPNLYTIHDLVPIRLPYATLDNKRRYHALCQEICATADGVVTVSEHSKRDIVDILKIDEKRVTVTYQAVDLPRAIIDRDEAEVAREIEAMFGLGWRDYFIFFGAVEPKKNLARVIEAYLASGVTSPLVIIGGKSWHDDDEIALMYEDLVELSVIREGLVRRADRVRLYGYLPFTLLVSLIRGAKATLLPSLYEGFGLPVLESMLLGTPVLASTEGSLPEVAGDAALLVDPYDAQEIRRGIVSLDNDSDLRAELSRRGAAQAAKFSPEAYRTRLADLYRPYG
jgi:glycosyltransferase involved in cell wall biosynthesis